MSETAGTVRGLIRSGFFQRAFDLIGATPVSSAAKADWEISRAELLQRLGHGDQAFGEASRCVTGRAATPVSRARAHLILGTEYRDKGDIQKGIDHFQKAAALASTAGDHQTQCWAELRLMLALSEAIETGVPSAFLSQVRTDVARLGDPHVSAALHLFIAQIETKRGLLHNAEQHLRIGRAVLEGNDNVWLQGVCSIHAYCICYSRSDFEGALTEARRALKCAHDSGHQGMARAAIANLGHLYLVSLQLKRSEKCLSLASRMSRGGESQAGILDGLAQVSMAKGRVDDCRQILERILGGETRAGDVSSYYASWALITKLRLLLRLRSPGEVLALATRLTSNANRPQFVALAPVLQLLQAEALLMAGRPAEATDLVCSVAEARGAEPLETLPRVGRMVAKLHQALGNDAAAAHGFEHAARMFASAGDECARTELLQDYAALLWPTVGRPADPPVAPARPPEWLSLRPTARRVTVHPRQATPLGFAAPPVTTATALQRAAALIDLAGRPLCVGQELQDLLGRCAAIANAAVVSRADAAPPEVLAYWGDYSRLHALLTAAAGVERIGLGRWRDKDMELLAEVGTGLDSRTAVIAARRLVEASLEIEAGRRERRERAALWPLEEPMESRYGVFASQAMTELVATARKIGPSNVTVLITGETGTGKEVLARIIHDASPRASRPFVPFNCAAVPRDMLDSQLFGYRRGAFTGALAPFPGVIRGAAGGTLLLDEIGEITPELQPKLLRFLEAQEVQPLGETHPVPVDVRVLAATNANLDDLLASGRFREDLYYRLNVVRLRVPPLRERREEIPVLVQHFLKRFAEENRKDNLRLAEETMEYLLLYSWPGNVRELLNQVRRLVALAENGAVLMPEHLPPEIVASRRTLPASERRLAPTEIVVRLDQPLAAAVEHVERAILPWAMQSAGGRVELAARMLGLSRKGLYLKRQRLGLEGADTPATASQPERTAP